MYRIHNLQYHIAFHIHYMLSYAISSLHLFLQQPRYVVVILSFDKVRPIGSN